MECGYRWRQSGNECTTTPASIMVHWEHISHKTLDTALPCCHKLSIGQIFIVHKLPGQTNSSLLPFFYECSISYYVANSGYCTSN